MKQIISAYGSLVTLVLFLFLCIMMSITSGNAAAAKEFKADVIAQIEDSNFNQNVIQACKEQAQAAGYTLEVTDCTYDADGGMQTAEIILGYAYNLPLLGIRDTKTTRGIAR